MSAQLSRKTVGLLRMVLEQITPEDWTNALFEFGIERKALDLIRLRRFQWADILRDLHAEKFGDNNSYFSDSLSGPACRDTLERLLAFALYHNSGPEAGQLAKSALDDGVEVSVSDGATSTLPKAADKKSSVVTGIVAQQNTAVPKKSGLLKSVWAIVKKVDAALHAAIMRAIPQAIPTFDRALEVVFGVVVHPAFALIAALLLGVLVLTGVIKAIVFFSILFAWAVAGLWIARAKPVRALNVTFRLFFVGIIGAALGVVGNSFGHWALDAYNRQKAAERPAERPGPTEEHTSGEPRQPETKTPEKSPSTQPELPKGNNSPPTDETAEKEPPPTNALTSGNKKRLPELKPRPRLDDSLKINAFAGMGNYVEGSQIGSINPIIWKSYYSEVDVIFVNTSSEDYDAFDVSVDVDQVIFAVTQGTAVPGVSVFSPNGGPGTQLPPQQKGPLPPNSVVMLPNNIDSSPRRVRCEKFPRRNDRDLASLLRQYLNLTVAPSTEVNVLPL